MRKMNKTMKLFGFPPALRVIPILLHEIRANDTWKITEETNHSGRKTSRSSTKPGGNSLGSLLTSGKLITQSGPHIQ